jgi:hypothetical protein
MPRQVTVLPNATGRLARATSGTLTDQHYPVGACAAVHAWRPIDGVVTTTRMQYNQRLAAIGAVLFFGIAVGCGDSAGPSRPKMSVDNLLAPAEFGVENWPIEGWQLYQTVSLRFGGTEYAKRRSWEIFDYSGELEQEIFKFGSPADAERKFDRADPRSYDEDFPLRVDESESYRSVSANESRLYCLGQEGSSEACPVWAYWARYGQYIMRLDHVAGLQTTDGDIFTLQSGIGLEQF